MCKYNGASSTDIPDLQTKAIVKSKPSKEPQWTPTSFSAPCFSWVQWTGKLNTISNSKKTFPGRPGWHWLLFLLSVLSGENRSFPSPKKPSAWSLFPNCHKGRSWKDRFSNQWQHQSNYFYTWDHHQGCWSGRKKGLLCKEWASSTDTTVGGCLQVSLCCLSWKIESLLSWFP